MSKEYIEREAVLSICNEMIAEPWNSKTAPVSWANAYLEFMDAVERLPASDVAPVRHGEWIERALRPTCSLCGFSGSLIDAPISPFKYCPNCGAKMDGDTP